MTPLIQDAALWLMPAGLAATGTAAVHYHRLATRRGKDVLRLQDEVRAGHERVAARDEEARHLAEVRLPALADGLRHGRADASEAAGLRHLQLAGSPFGRSQQAVLERVAALLSEASERAEGAARSSVQAVTRSLQALVYEQQRAITDMLESQHDEKVLAYAIPIDHACSQLARRAQIVGVLTGTWPGRQRDDSPLLDVVRGGISRIRDYRRVRITGEPTEYVTSRVVEPVVLAVAELLDNAARHSEPGTSVDVWFVHAHNGLSIIIDDAGIGLRPEDREMAARMLSGSVPVRLTELRNPPRLGFVAIGALAARYGFHVSVEQQSVHGGVRTVLHIPRALLAVPLPANAPQELPAPSSATVPAGPGEEYPVAQDGLPVRRRTSNRRPGPAAPAATRPRADAGRNLAAFVRGAESARPNLDEETTS